MSAPYYDRAETLHVDGSPVFSTDADRAGETDVAAMLERAWHCTIAPFGPLAPIDFYATRDGRLVGVLELKTRSQASDRFPTVFLSVRKWLALTLAETGLGCPAIFVVRFADAIRWVSVRTVDASAVELGGCALPRNRRRGAITGASDREPVILVPIATMRPLEASA